jgi:pimeloyl-ACP methyl ester carboxylesterase
VTPILDAVDRRLAGLIGAAAVLSSCAVRDPSVTAREGSTVVRPFERGDALPTAPALPTPAPIEWHGCEPPTSGWQCATLEVPLDYRQPNTDRRIELALTRLPATDPASRIGSLLVNPGGPGGSGIDLVRQIAPDLPDELRRRFDFVGFDPRGIGASTPVVCTYDHDVAENVPFTVSTEDIASSCVDGSGDLLPHLGSPNVARDMDEIRAAVGDDQLTFLGYSYGTALGAVYAQMFPEHARALVLDGTVDPAAGEFNVDTDSSFRAAYARQRFDRTQSRLLQECARTLQCPISDHPERALAAIEEQLYDGDMPAPRLPGGRHLDLLTYRNVVTQSLYTSASWPYLAYAIDEAANGDASLLVGLADRYMQMRGAQTLANLQDANLAVYCADFAGHDVDGRTQVPDCKGWPATADPLPPIEHAPGAPSLASKVLVVGTIGDPATPVENTAPFAAALGHVPILYWDGDGHTAFLQGNHCVDAAVTRYLVDLAEPASGTHCPAFDGATGRDQQARRTFTVDRHRFRERYAQGLVAGGTPAVRADCIADWFSRVATDRQLVTAYLGVRDAGLAARLRIDPPACGA